MQAFINTKLEFNDLNFLKKCLAINLYLCTIFGILISNKWVYNTFSIEHVLHIYIMRSSTKLYRRECNARIHFVHYGIISLLAVKQTTES